MQVLCAFRIEQCCKEGELMISGFDTALGEVTLVLFTTLAPSGAVALVLVAAVLLLSKFESAMRARISTFMCIPLVVTMVGLVASATHLGNPANALYVFLHVGSSPLSNEVVSAVGLLACSGLYWLYSFSVKPLVWLQRLLLALIAAMGVVFVTMVSLAYSVDTIVTWSLPTVPISLWLNALVGGPLLAAITLYAAQWRALAGRFGLLLMTVPFIALAANMAAYIVQGRLLNGVANSVVAAADLVPHYRTMLLVFALMCFAGCVLAAFTMHAVSREAVAHGGGELAFSKRVLVRLLVLCLLVFAGIFVMRFAFYMMHLMVGLAV